MQALLLLTSIKDETVSPDDVKVLCINSEGRLLTMVISKSLYSKWSSNVEQACIQSKGYCALVDFTFSGEVSHARIVNITEDEAKALDNIVNFALTHPESLSKDGMIPKDMLWAPSHIIDNAIKYIEANKDYFLNKESNIASVIGKDNLRAMEREGVFIDDITDKSSLALCIWEMGIQLKGRNSYVILIFTTERKLQFHIVEMVDTVTNAREAIFRLFGFNDPLKISFEKPRASLKKIISELNPARLLNPKYIPYSAILPKNNNEIYLCMDKPNDSLKLGIILANSQPATVKIKSDDQLKDSTLKLFASVCTEFICHGSTAKYYTDTLNTLLSYATSGSSYPLEKT